MNTLSIEEAIKAVKLATSELEKIKEKQRIAEEKVKAASIELEISNTKKDELEKKLESTSGQYSNASFWNDRYKETIDNNEEETTYEWYVSFDDIKLKVDRDILDNSNNYAKSIMVSGCGNSSLCEDLEKYGFISVIGTDYSKEALMIMIQRATDNNYKCKYIETDVCDMNNIPNDSYDIVMDKGTLDAVASANNENETLKSLKSVGAYIRETWRVLVLKGKFIIITTMPENIFESIAMSAIDSLSASNWKNCIKEKLKTEAGGEIYYYCITKTSNLSKTPTSRRMSQTDIEEGIQSLLENAVKARNELHANDREMAEFEDALNIDERQKPSSIAQLVPLKVPIVKLSLRNQSNSIKAKTIIEVEYILHDGDWDDCDQVCLVCVSNSLDKRLFLYNNKDNQKYEYFEYTNKPEQLKENEFKGIVSFTLPPYGGNFVLTYTRGSNELARSIQFSILCPIQHSSPDLNLNNSVRRRGIGSMNSKIRGAALNMIAEDMKNIKCFQVSGTAPSDLKDEPNSSLHLSRIMSWIYEVSLNEWNITFESDIIYARNDKNGQDISMKIVYGIITIQNLNINNLLIEEAHCEVDGSGRIVCRIPYKADLHFSSPIEDIEVENIIDTEIRCRYCNQLLLKDRIKETRLLPTGILDNMMHEFFCCEEMPLQAMSSSEIESINSSLILGSIQVTVHPTNVKSNSLKLTCKTTSTIIDLVYGYAGQVAISKNNRSHDRCESCLSRSANLIDVDTCLLSCSRCSAYLGDGSICNENNDDESKSSSFLLNDLKNIRFALHSVTFLSHAPHDKLKRVNLSIENVVARTLVHFANAHRYYHHHFLLLSY